MEVIDLIDIKEKPKKINVGGNKYNLNENSCEFRTWYLDKNGHNWYDDYLLVFNETVEIIEDKPEKIEKIKMPEIDNVKNERICHVEYKINEIIDKLNYLLEKSDKE